MSYNVGFFSGVIILLMGLISSCNSNGPVSGELPAIVPRPVAPVTQVSDPGLFLPGDNLELFVKEDATLNSSYPVRDGGYIVIPRAGRIQVLGLSRADAEKRVKEALQRTQLTEATVLVERTTKQSLLSTTPGGGVATPKIMIYVTGAVLKPGTHYVPLIGGRPLGVYETLLITGGLARLAQDQKVEVMRVDSAGHRHRAVFDLRRVKQGLADDPPVGEGDIIHVPEKVFGF